jgi:hypothetical protein
MKKFFSVLFAVVLAMAIIVVPVSAQAEVEPPENPETWLSGQEFQAPVCNPMSYQGWVEEEFDPTGGELNHYDLIAQPYQTFVVWGSGVSIDGQDYGRALIVLNGGETGGRWHAVIVDGAYRVGTDFWGFFPKYWQKVLVCLYGGEFPITSVGEWVTPVEVEEVVSVAPSENIEGDTTTTLQGEVGPQGPQGDKGDIGPQGPAGKDATVWPLWLAVVILGGGLLWALLRNRQTQTNTTTPTPNPAVVSDEITALKRKVSNAKGGVTRATNALNAYSGTDPVEIAKLNKAVKTARFDLKKAEKALKDAQTPPPTAPQTPPIPS